MTRTSAFSRKKNFYFRSVFLKLFRGRHSYLLTWCKNSVSPMVTHHTNLKILAVEQRLRRTVLNSWWGNIRFNDPKFLFTGIHWFACGTINLLCQPFRDREKLRFVATRYKNIMKTLLEFDFRQ